LQNILITAAGHIKLTDFGGCRAYTEAAHTLLTESRGLLSRLRDGDWRDNSKTGGGAGSADSEVSMSIDNEGTELPDDNRFVLRVRLFAFW
jgi:serine/threonine protein kinase